MVSRVKQKCVIYRGKRTLEPANSQVPGVPYIRQYSDGSFMCSITNSHSTYYGYGMTMRDAYIYCKQQTAMIDAWCTALEEDCPSNLFKTKSRWWQFWRKE
ncbi:hypothetical protein D3C81_442030 [compost metagenome]